MTRTNSFTIKASLTTLLVIISFFCFYMSYSDFVKINNEYAYIYDDVDINYFDKKKFQKYYDIISIENLDDPVFDKEKSKIEEEFGDLLFSLVNYSRHKGIDSR